jgi:hypothetical protein
LPSPGLRLSQVPRDRHHRRILFVAAQRNGLHGARPCPAKRNEYAPCQEHALSFKVLQAERLSRHFRSWRSRGRVQNGGRKALITEGMEQSGFPARSACGGCPLTFILSPLKGERKSRWRGYRTDVAPRYFGLVGGAHPTTDQRAPVLLLLGFRP